MVDAALDALDDLAETTDYSVVGPRDNRVHVVDTTRFPFMTVCHLERDFGDGRRSGCSGVLIGPHRVLTAAHCLYHHLRQRPPRRIRVMPGRRGRDSLPFGWQPAARAYVPQAFVDPSTNTQRKLHDYGVVLVPKPFSPIKRFLPLKALADAELDALKAGDLITIAGYPGDRPVGTMWSHQEKLKRATPGRLLYTVDTCPGHSGSPIWCRPTGSSQTTVVGVHTSGIIDEQGRAYGCARGTIMAPPGTFNSGIRLTAAIIANVRSPDRLVDGRPVMRRLV